jgi:hypothetical protein
MGINLQLATSVEVDDGFAAFFSVQAVCQGHITFGPKFQVKHTCLLMIVQINPGHALFKPRLHDAQLNQDLALHEDNESAVFLPRGDLVGINLERFRVARIVANEPKRLLRATQGAQASQNRPANQITELPNCERSPHLDASRERTRLRPDLLTSEQRNIKSRL